MGRTLDNLYTDRAETNPAFPWQRFKNWVEGVENSGTPLDNRWANQIEAYFQAFMAYAGLDYSNIDDTAIRSQFKQAMISAMHQQLNGFPSATPEMICSGDIGSQMEDPSSALNHLVLTTSDTSKDSCIGWDFDNDRPMIFELSDLNQIRTISGCRDRASSPAVVDEYTHLHLETPSTGDRVSICHDGAALYMAWVRTSDSHYMVSKYTMDPMNGTALWHYDSGDVAPSGFEEHAKLTIANGSMIALSLITGVTGSPRAGIAIIDKTTGIGVRGVGTATDAGSITGPVRNGRIVSDGDHIFWIVNQNWSLDTAQDTIIHSASIANPTTSSYTAGTVATVARSSAPRSFPSNIIAAGRKIIIASADGQIYKFDQDSDIVCKVAEISNFADYASGSTSYGASLGYDRSNVWFMSIGEDALQELCKLPAGMFGKRCTLAYHPETYQANKVMLHGITGSLDADNEPGQLLFEGQDLWLVHRTDGVYRITNPALR